MAPQDSLALGDIELGAVGNAVARALPARLVAKHNLEVAAHHHRRAGAVAHHILVFDLHRCVERRFDARLLRAALGRAADVEGTHGELRAGLADRLRRDDADRLADIGKGAAREIAPVAEAAHAVFAITGQHRADLHHLDVGALDRVDAALVDHLAGVHDGLA